MSGGRAAKQKGNRVERECVNLAKSFGFESRRAWGSDGRSLGWHEEVDMVIELPKSNHINFKSKLVKKLVTCINLVMMFMDKS